MLYYVIQKETWDLIEDKDQIAERYSALVTADDLYVLFSSRTNIGLPGINPLSFASFKAWKAAHPQVFDGGLPVGITPVFTVTE